MTKLFRLKSLGEWIKPTPPTPAGVVFTKHPSNQTVSQGNEVRLGCAVEGVTEPEITWMKDGEKLYSTDQVFLTLGEQHWETSHRCRTLDQCFSPNLSFDFLKVLFRLGGGAARVL